MRAYFWLTLVLSLVIWSFLPTPVRAEDWRTVSMVERWEKAFRLRQQVLENRHGMKFDEGWSPQVVFAPKGGYNPYVGNYWAAYDDSTDSFLVDRLLRCETMSPSRFSRDVMAIGRFGEGTDELVRLIDHELTHAYCNQMHQRLGLGSWLAKAKREYVTWESAFGWRTLSEGIAEYYGSTSFYPNVDLPADIIPDKVDDFAFGPYKVPYVIGDWLVRPILDHFGQDGLIYLLTHPFVFCDGDFQDSVLSYQRQAIAELSNGQ